MSQIHGDKLVCFGLLIWMSVSVGPWWIGLILFLCGMVVNLSVRLAKKKEGG